MGVLKRKSDDMTMEEEEHKRDGNKATPCGGETTQTETATPVAQLKKSLPPGEVHHDTAGRQRD